MAETDEEEKTQDPTPKRLEDARKRGEIPKSTELTTAASYAGFLLALVMLGADGAQSLATGFAGVIDHADSLSGPDGMVSGTWLFGHLAGILLLDLAPLFGMPALCVLLALFAQRAIHFAPDKLIPKLSRISMITGAKNKFGANGLFEFAKSAFKLVVVSVLLTWFLISRSDELITTTALEPRQMVVGISDVLIGFLVLVLLMSIIIGGADYLWQIAEHFRKNRMSYKELKDEVKESEGDPHFKQARRQRGYDIAMNQMLVEVPSADVIIVNPTHYAVALKWERLSGHAPICVAKGVDEIAARIREIADENDVPIYEDPPTARALHATVAIGDQIEREQYQAVAAAIRFAEMMRNKMAQKT